jgi:hypothetical protein
MDNSFTRIFAVFIVICIFIFSTAFSFAGSAGSNGAAFLKIGVGARALALGDTAVSWAADPSALYWNPAGLGRMDSTGYAAQFTHDEWLADTSYDSLALTVKLENYGNVGLMFNYLSSDEITGYDVSSAPTGSFEVNSTSTVLGWGIGLGENFNAGLTLKWIGEDIADDSANGFAADLGLQFTPGIDGLYIGAAVSNIGGSLKYEDTEDDYPLQTRLGVSCLTVNDTVLVAGQVTLPKDQDAQFGLGLEYVMLEMVSVRAGFRNDGDEGHFSLGGGLDFSKISIDYAFMPRGELGDIQRLTLGFVF